MFACLPVRHKTKPEKHHTLKQRTDPTICNYLLVILLIETSLPGCGNMKHETRGGVFIIIGKQLHLSYMTQEMPQSNHLKLKPF